MTVGPLESTVGATELRALAPKVLGVLVRRGADFATAEDALQEALIRALSTWGDDPPSDPEGWLITVSWRAFLDLARSAGARGRARVGAPSRHTRSPSPPPRARRPVTSPSGHAGGSAGSPKRPKMSTALSAMFTTLPIVAAMSGVFVSPAPWSDAAATASTKASGSAGSTIWR